MKKTLLITVILLAIASFAWAIDRMRWKIISSSPGTLRVRKGSEYGILQYDPDILIVENEGITFLNFDMATMTVWVRSEKTGAKKLIKINEI